MDRSNKNENFKKQFQVLRSSDCHLMKVLLKQHRRLPYVGCKLPVPQWVFQAKLAFYPYFSNFFSEVTVKVHISIWNQRVFLLSSTWTARQTKGCAAEWHHFDWSTREFGVHLCPDLSGACGQSRPSHIRALLMLFMVSVLGKPGGLLSGIVADFESPHKLPTAIIN